MTDRELLELAAKAAGVGFNEKRSRTGSIALHCPRSFGWWNPLHDNDDALWLAVKLGFCVNIKERCVVAGNSPTNDWQQPHGDDPYAATRRAIVRAAAEIGRNME